jgi:hypothetical protein
MPLISATSTYRSLTLAYLSSASSLPTFSPSNGDVSASVDTTDVPETQLLPISSSLPLIPSFKFASSTSDYSWAAQTAESSESIAECPQSTSSLSLTSSSSSSSSVSIPLSILALAFPLPPTTLPQRPLNKPPCIIVTPDNDSVRVSELKVKNDQPSSVGDIHDTVVIVNDPKARFEVETFPIATEESLIALPVSRSVPPPLRPSSEGFATKENSSMRRSYPFFIPRTNLPASEVEPLRYISSKAVCDASPCPPESNPVF